MCVKKHSFFYTRPLLSPWKSATVIKIVHMTITSFHINLYANKSYLIDANPLGDSFDTPKFYILENTMTKSTARRI